ncbi:MAG: sugar ABC transporter permease [Arachnia propionica]|nr:MAG: sugar ABC transporter permease [Arachnia propionica]
MWRKWQGLLLVLPSILLVLVFVYGLIGDTMATSLLEETRRTFAGNEQIVSPGGFANYGELLGDPRYQRSLWNLAVLTFSFVGGTMFFGILWALLLEKGIAAEGFFRSVYLFPMAVSFIASGTVWKWLLSPGIGDHEAIGLNRLFLMVGLPELQSKWWSDPGMFNMIAMAMPAVWQLSGYVMALFLAGFRGISEDQREAARVDGASEWKIYRHVLFPQLSPIALSALIIIGHMSMKTFDLIYAISGQNNYVADVPATLMWTQLFAEGNAPFAAANATILLLIVAVVVVPYLVYTNRTEQEGR